MLRAAKQPWLHSRTRMKDSEHPTRIEHWAEQGRWLAHLQGIETLQASIEAEVNEVVFGTEECAAEAAVLALGVSASDLEDKAVSECSPLPAAGLHIPSVRMDLSLEAGSASGRTPWSVASALKVLRL